MVSTYVRAAMSRARIELGSNGVFFGTVPNFPDGICAFGGTYNDCYDALRIAVESEVEDVLTAGEAYRLPTIARLRPEGT